MSIRHSNARVTWLLVLAALLSLAAACGGDDDDGGEASSKQVTTTTEATTTTVDAEAEKATVGKVTTDWFAAFAAQDLDTAVRLLQNGEAHRAQFVHCQNVSAGVSVTMKTVDLTDARNATTTYDIVVDGSVVVPDAGGAAVKVDGEWLVAESTFLSLYDLAKDGCTGPPPPAS